MGVAPAAAARVVDDGVCSLTLSLNSLVSPTGSPGGCGSEFGDFPDGDSPTLEVLPPLPDSDDETS